MNLKENPLFMLMNRGVMNIIIVIMAERPGEKRYTAKHPGENTKEQTL
jgi:hypothetical protein